MALIDTLDIKLLCFEPFVHIICEIIVCFSLQQVSLTAPFASLCTVFHWSATIMGPVRFTLFRKHVGSQNDCQSVMCQVESIR